MRRIAFLNLILISWTEVSNQDLFMFFLVKTNLSFFIRIAHLEFIIKHM